MTVKGKITAALLQEAIDTLREGLAAVAPFNNTTSQHPRLIEFQINAKVVIRRAEEHRLVSAPPLPPVTSMERKQ